MSAFLEVDRQALASIHAQGWRTGILPKTCSTSADGWVAYDDMGCRIEAPTLGELAKRTGGAFLSTAFGEGS